MSNEDSKEFNKLFTDDEIVEVEGKSKPCPFCNGVSFIVRDFEDDRAVVTFHREDCVFAQKDERYAHRINPQSTFTSVIKYFFSSGINSWETRGGKYPYEQ